jgi:hypothetical protein
MCAKKKKGRPRFPEEPAQSCSATLSRLATDTNSTDSPVPFCRSAIGPMPKAVNRLGFYGLSSADFVAFNDGTNARPARVTFAGFLYSYSSCFSADVHLNGFSDIKAEE